MNNIFYKRDILTEIGKFLTFEDKVKLGNLFDTRLTKYYDFGVKNFTHKYIADIFDESRTDDFCDFITEWLSCYLFTIEKYYVIYLYRDELSSDESDNDSIDSDDSLDSDDLYRRIDNNFDLNPFIVTRTTEFILSTIFHIYPRKIIEIIEDNGLDIKYDSNVKLYNLAELLPVDLDMVIIDYYKSILLSDVDIDVFCKRCGIFGHEDTCKSCLFYTEKYYWKESRKKIYNIINEINNKAIERFDQEKREEKRIKTLCKKCNQNIFSPHCIGSNCKNCCDNHSCPRHKNK